MKKKLFSILALLLMAVPQGAWARDNYTPTQMSTKPTEGPWTFDAVSNGYYNNSHGWTMTFNSADHSAWEVYKYVDQITYQWRDDDGIGFSMDCTSIASTHYGVLSTYTHSESVSSYTRKVLTWKFYLRGKSNKYPQNVTLYAHNSLSDLKATTVDFTADYSDKTGSTYKLVNLSHGASDATQQTSLQTKTFDFDNRNGSSTQTKTWALMMTHVANNTGAAATCHQWGAFKNDSYTWTTYYYKYVTFNSNGGTGSMTQQTVENSATLKSNTFTRTGYTFAGWNTKADGTGTNYANGATINATESSKGNVTLYAKWTANSYSVRFNKNATDATGSMSNEAFTYGTAKALTSNAFSRPGYTFARWNTKADGTGNNYTDGQSVSNLTSTKDGTVDLYAQWTENKITLNETVNNSNWITLRNGQVWDVTLTRTLSATGWNTFCVPFNIPAANWATYNITAVKKLTGSSLAGDVVTLTFEAETTAIEAGKPYMVKVSGAVANPTFNNVTISNAVTPTETTYADFKPVMNPTAVTKDDKSVLFLTGGTTLTWPNDAGTIKGFRAYLLLKGAAASARGFEMNLDGDVTGISGMKTMRNAENEKFFDLQGRRVAQPAKGLYIVNGRKVIVK